MEEAAIQSRRHGKKPTYSFFIRQVLVLCLLGCCSWQPAAQRQMFVLEKTSRYVVEEINLGSQGSLTRISARRTGKILWQCKRKEQVDPAEVEWSPDRRYLALVQRWIGLPQMETEGHRILIWHVGGKVRQYDLPNEDDTYVHLIWSPDNQHVLIRGFSSGGLDDDSGTLLCLRLRDGHVYRVDKGVRKAKWIGSSRIRYWVEDSHAPWVPDTRNPGEDRKVPGVEKKPREWKCP